MIPRAALLALLVPPLAASCAAPDARPIVVVGFRSDPAASVSGVVMTSPDGTDFGTPLGVAEREWLVAVTPRGSGFSAIGLSGGLYDGDESGARWRRRPMHDAWLSAVRYLATDPEVGLLSGADAWWKSTDGGRSWQARRPPGFYFEDFSFSDRERGVAVEAYLVPSRGIVWRTTNGGASWNDALEVDRGLRVLGRPDPQGDEVWAAGDGGALTASTNGGVSWIPVGTVPLAGAPDYAGIDFASPNEGYVAGSNGVIRVWRPGSPISRRWGYALTGDYVLQGVFARGGGEAWACGYRTHSDLGVVLRTVDAGAHWSEVARTPHVFWYGVSGRR